MKTRPKTKLIPYLEKEPVFFVRLETRMHCKVCWKCKARVYPSKEWWDKNGENADFKCEACEFSRRV
mgnify:CR=1 FL=1